MSKHTPGPWSFWSGYNHVDKIEAQVTAEDGDIVIASYNHMIAEGENNARLIAAAPDLLGSLEDCVSELELYANTHHPKGADGARDHMVKIMLARSAIAKARGEQP